MAITAFFLAFQEQEKTTLSSDPNRRLIGDCMSMAGMMIQFSTLKVRCYADMHRLKKEITMRPQNI